MAGGGVRPKPEMASHGVGTKYVSVNLNKSYGQQPLHHYNHAGGYGSNRGRPGGSGGSGGGGMVVLSRPRSSQKAGPKLSVPPPLNLPSMRKEYERNDSLGSNGHSGGGISGSGSRPASSGMGWIKPAASKERERLDGDIVSDDVDGASKGVYMPPVARFAPVERSDSASDRGFPPVEKVAILRGEDFPSLRATLPVTSGPGQKQSEGLNQKPKQAAGEELFKEQRDASCITSSLVDTKSLTQSGNNHVGNEFSEAASFQHGLHSSEQGRKQGVFFPEPLLPLARMNLNPRSDWADDERDTSHGLRDWDRNQGYSKNEAFWDRDFHMPRTGLFPRKTAAHDPSGRWGQRENETGKTSSGDSRTQNEGGEVNAWRVSSPIPKVVENGRNDVGARPSSRGRELIKENKYLSSPFRDNIREGTGMRNAAFQHGGRQLWNNSTTNTLSNHGMFARDRYDNEQQNRDRRPFSKREKPYLEDPFMKDFGDSSFDVRDPLPVLGVVKKKKEALKQTDFHDPVRESFEAELERVQKMQEEERRRIIEEQERAMELARREEEERLQLAREEEERHRRVEEEAREAVWRAEQERLEATRRVEELRKAKEEEKHRILLEEERRKQAAMQKLRELEEKIAKRQAEASKCGCGSSTVSEEKTLAVVKEREVSGGEDTVDWEDGEKMVETSAPSDLPVPNRSFEMSTGPHFSRDGSSGFLERRKPANPWRKDHFENGNNSAFISQDIEHVTNSQLQDGGRVFRKDFLDVSGYATSSSYYKAGIMEPRMDEFSHYVRSNEMDSEFHESLGEPCGDVGWGRGQGRSRCNPYSAYTERPYQNPEEDDYCTLGTARYSVRQPHVLPPPSLASMHKSAYRDEADRPGPSTFSENEIKCNSTGGIKSTAQAGYGSYLDDEPVQPADHGNEEQQLDRKPSPRCDSQSSLSVSSPPESPIHLSHDDLDESGDSSVLLGKDKEPIVISDAREDNLIAATGSVSSGEDEEWTLANNEQLQEQEEYDDDEDGYREEDEIHEGNQNIDLTQEFEEMHLQEKDSNLVLGFNEGVEVEMHSDDFEKCSRNEEAEVTMPQDSADFLEGQGYSYGVSSDKKTIQHAEVPAEVEIDNTSGVFLETEKGMQNLAVQPNNALQASGLSQPVDKVNSSTNSVISMQPTPLASLNMAPQLSTIQSAVTSASSAPCQIEEPVKLQFGLFSGPSLIPSPVTAIQIGSIQMPLPLHPQVGLSSTHMQPPQPPFFQLGQLRYTSPISQGGLPLPPQSFVQPNAPSSFGLNKIHEASGSFQLGQGNSANNLFRNAVLTLSDSQAGVVMRPLGISKGNMFNSDHALPVRERTGNASLQQKRDEMPCESEPASREEVQGKPNSVEGVTEGQHQTGVSRIPLVSKGKDMSRPKYPGQGGRGKLEISAIKGSGSQSSGVSDGTRVDSIGFKRASHQRLEFRVRAPNQLSSGDSLNASGRFSINSTRNATRKILGSDISTEHITDSAMSGSAPVAFQRMNSGSRSEVGAGKETVAKSQNLSNSGQKYLKRNLISKEAIDLPLQSGIVRVFEQPGIEAPSDDDDFIEVRSKRQMLNDRREQREKEIKAKSRAAKVRRKPRSTVQNTVASSGSNEISAVSRSVNSQQSNPVTSKQPLAPIGTPAHKADAQPDTESQTFKSLQTSALPAVSGVEQNLASSFIFDRKNKVVDNIQTLLGSWDNSRIDQPVMALTQSQLDEAMKPVSLDLCGSVEDRASSINEPNIVSTCILAKNKTFPPAAIPINSLPGVGKSQIGEVSSSIDLSESGCSLEKRLTESSAHMEDCEAEAEAAASAVAVAAIASDDIGGIAGSGSVSVSENKSFGGVELDRAAGSGIAGEQSGQSKAEESLSVSLPADLSVETPPISLWPQLPSPHNSNQMISHFPPGLPHFPFYDMNPMLRAPIFAFNPRDESGSNTRPQPQKGHSCVDSFYGPPYTSPFISPPGGVPGVQAPPHMVVYNHFAPVGQFGQVGLSFMGTTYIPTGKQPDLKHNPVSSAVMGEAGDASNSSMVSSSQRNPTIVPASVQHLAPGSALLPMPPLGMFDVSPFQSPEIPIHARWPHVPPSPLQPPPLSMPLQQQQPQQQQSEAPPLPSQLNNVRTSAPSESTRNFRAATDSTVNCLPDELVLSDSKTTSSSTLTETAGKSSTVQNTSSGFKPPPQFSQQNASVSTQQYGNSSSSGYNSNKTYNNNNRQRVPQRNDWPHHRRLGFHGRNQSIDGEKGFPNTKVKQIYVAKQTSSNSSTSTAVSHLEQ